MFKAPATYLKVSYLTWPYVVFFYPFFLLKHLKLRRQQKIALIGVFSLGAITLIVSLSRFIAYNATNFELDDESGSTYSLFFALQHS